MSNLYHISCVLKSGGDYNWNHVRNLKRQLDKHLTLSYKLHVLSDLNMPSDLQSKGSNLIVLKRNYPGWWSKIELFYHFNHTFYLDLDTYLVGNINHIVSWPHMFTGIRGFYGRPFGSGIMSWNGDYRFIYENFEGSVPIQLIDYFFKKRMGDQEWIGEQLKVGLEQEPDIFQDIFPDQIVSYKIHVQGIGLPERARIVCFHGRPRIQDVSESWMQEIDLENLRDNQSSFVRSQQLDFGWV